VELVKDIKRSQDPTNVFGVANNVFSDWPLKGKETT
jgi:hypothetical protein